MAEKMFIKAYLPLLLNATLWAVAAPSHAQSVDPVAHLRATPDTVEWGYIDARARPILRIKSGDTVAVETTLEGSQFMHDMGVPEHLIRPAMRVLEAGVKDRLGPHILLGPIFVAGAEPGDVLEIRILTVKPADDYGMNVFFPDLGALPSEFPYRRVRVIPLDVDRNVALFAPGIEIPLRPFFGVMAVAPPLGETSRINSIPSGYYGGNMDNKELVAGTTLYLPVHCEGALFSIGDGHVAQGDGEVDLTAIEAALSGTLQFRVRKDMRLAWPRAESPDSVVTMGFDPDLNRAAQMATDEMVNYLVSERHLSRDDAYMLTSVAADLHVTQIVDGTKGVHAILAKKIFTQK